MFVGLSEVFHSHSSKLWCSCGGLVPANLQLGSGRQPPRTLVITNVLKPWQIQRLEKASAQGRKNISIKELCGDLQLQRADVLQWLKDHQPREDRPSRTPLEPGSPDVDHYSWGDNNASLAGSTSQPQQMHKQRLRLPKEIPDGARAAPWAQTYGLKKLPKAAELTLEKVYSEWTHPPNAIVDSLWDLHQIPRRRALDWFAKRRAAEAQNSL